MNKRFWVCAAAMLILVSGLFYACSKQGAGSSSSSSTPHGQQAVAFYLTDGPGLFDSVYIDVQTVAVVVDTCSNNAFDYFDQSCAVKDTVNFNAGLYNVTSLTNGIDTVLASGNIHAGTVKRINITLGSGSYLVKNGVHYPLNMYPGVDSHLVIELRGDEFQNTANINNLWLDFDVQHSIYQLRDGNFYLWPVIRIFAVQKSAGLTGQVLPRDAAPVISVYNSTDTVYAITNFNGNFMVRGLATDTYSVFINPSNGYQDTTINNVSVTVGGSTNIGTITLHK